MFVADHPIAAVRPADYNPRRISPEAFEQLRASVRTLGMIRPIIVTSAGRLIAGHQRTKAMLAEGITAAPAHVLDDVSQDDEIRFNQIHNAADKELADAQLSIAGKLSRGWSAVDPVRLQVAKRPGMAAKLVEVTKLMARHGPFSGAVVGADGRILAGHLYAFACSLLGVPLHVFTLPRRLAAPAREFLAAEYGVFSYDHLPRTTWVQSLAQMHRIRRGRAARGKSRTYEEQVLPRLKRGMRVLDFGAGQMDYVRHLRRRRYDIIGVEFYRRKPGTMALDLPAIHADIDRLCERLRSGGLFDMVVCDSVLNSIDSTQAESDVLTTINALCRPSGAIVFSGRRMAFTQAIEHKLNYSRSSFQRNVVFPDADGMTAMFQRGVWLFQKLHTDEQVRAHAAATIGPGAELRIRGSAWAAAGVKSIERAGQADALAREFDLPLPDGSRIGRAGDVAKAWRTALSA